jgi:uncharacterized protein YcfL
MRILLPVLTALLLAGCASEPKLDDATAHTVCLAMTMGPNLEAGIYIANRHGITDRAHATAAVRAAVRDNCPQYLAAVGG